MSSPVVAVVGATGAQGGGLVSALLADPQQRFRVRAVTRTPESDAGRALAARGAEVVAGSSDDLDSMTTAFKGAQGAFCLTNFWEHFSPEREMAQAQNLAMAAKAAGVGHVVWSTLEDSRRFIPLSDSRMPTLMGHYKVPHFDAKGASDRFFAESGVPTTFLLTSFYWDNFIHFGMGPKPAPDGVLTFGFPMGGEKLPGIAADDIGGVAAGVFARGTSLAGQYVGASGEHLTGDEMAVAMSRAMGRMVRFAHVPADVYRGFGFPGADDLANMFVFNPDCAATFRAARPVTASRDLHPGLKTFDQWLVGNASRIPIG
jgi:uncharacterized protein YbjT (DUF2867 family)